MKKDFNEFRFKGLNWRKQTNKYLTMDRVSDDKTKVVVKVGNSHLIPTQYGYAFIVGYHSVVFVKNWQVSQNYYGTEILLDKNYFNVKEWGNFEDDFYFEDEEKKQTFDYWLEVAEAQSLKDEDGSFMNPVKWEK